MAVRSDISSAADRAALLEFTRGRLGRLDLLVNNAGVGPAHRLDMLEADEDGFDRLIDLAAPGGRIVFFGATRGNPPGLAMRKVFWRQLSLLGTTMGSSDDFGAMTRFVVEHGLRPVISEVFPLDRCAEAFALMERGAQCGKIVVRIR